MGSSLRAAERADERELVRAGLTLLVQLVAKSGSDASGHRHRANPSCCGPLLVAAIDAIADLDALCRLLGCANRALRGLTRCCSFGAHVRSAVCEWVSWPRLHAIVHRSGQARFEKREVASGVGVGHCTGVWSAAGRRACTARATQHTLRGRNVHYDIIIIMADGR
eukprot:6215715-Prymnesium_polylepis.2